MVIERVVELLGEVDRELGTAGQIGRCHARSEERGALPVDHRVDEGLPSLLSQRTLFRRGDVVLWFHYKIHSPRQGMRGRRAGFCDCPAWPVRWPRHTGPPRQSTLVRTA